MLTHLKPFGAKCSVFIPSSKRGTKSHSNRGQIGHFIGIEEDGLILYRVYLPTTCEIAVSSDVKFLNRESTALMDSKPFNLKSSSPASAIAHKEASMGDSIPEMDIDDFHYLVGTRHVDSVDGLLYETTRVLEEGQYLVAYRRLVLKDGTVFKRTEDGPIHVRDVAQMTELVGVPGAELQVDDVVATDPECDKPKNHDHPDLGDALDQKGDKSPCGGDRSLKLAPDTMRRGTIPTNSSGEDKSKSTHSLDRPSVWKYAAVIPPMHLNDELGRNGNRKSSGSVRGLETTKAKRVRVDSSMTTETQPEPITNSSPTLPDRHSSPGMEARLPERGEKDRKQVARAARGTYHETADIRRPGLRPRVRQRLNAHAMAGNAFSAIAMILLTVTACTINGDIAIAPTAIQPDPLTRAQIIISKDRGEWEAAERAEMASMRSNNVFTECDLPPGRKAVKTKWIY